jgi:WD40 repeat protein
MIEKWLALINQLEVIENAEGSEIWSEAELQKFEFEASIILPENYKEFCQVFGTGLFGEYMRIYCPDSVICNLLLNSIKDEINKLAAPKYEKIFDFTSLAKLFDSAFVFGDTLSENVVFWDLRTYDEFDKSYDIYIANSDCFDGKVYKVGRDFYEFVRDFCLGMKSYEVLPESMRPSPQELILTFYRFTSQTSEFIDTNSWLKNQQIWQNNVASGVVHKIAQTYEEQGQFIEALLLHIQQLKIGVSSSETSHLFATLKRLHNAIGETLFCAICQAANYPPEELLMSMVFVNSNLTGNVNLQQEAECLKLENLPDPDAEFQQILQEFFQSFQEQLTTDITADSSNNFQQIQQKIRQIYQNFVQVAQPSKTADSSPNDFSGFNSQQAGQTLEESASRLKEKYPPHQRLFARYFQHLHLPLGSVIVPPDNLRQIENKEQRQQEQAVRGKNPYAFFRYLRTFKGSFAPVYSVLFSPDGKTLVSGDAGGIIKVNNLNSAREHRTLIGHIQAVTSLALSPDGKTLVSGSGDSTIKLWNFSAGDEIQTLIGHSNSILSIAISPDSQTLVSGSADTTIKLWDLSTGQVKSTLISHANSVLSAAISPDGQTLASGSADATVKLWDLRTGQEIRTLDEGGGFVFAVCFHPHEPILVSVHENRTIKLWNLLNGEIIRSIPTSEMVVSVAISPDGKTLAGASGSSPMWVIGLWNLDAGKMISSFRGYDGPTYHQDIVYTVAFSPDGQTLASGSKDTTVKLWGTPPPINIES